MGKNQDYYSILGVRRDASIEEIRLAYFEAARKYHPDKNVAPGETELFIEAQEAFEVLSNPKKRSQYDASLPPEKEPLLPIDQRVLFSRSHLLKLNEPQLIYAFLEFLPKEEIELTGAPPLNICLIIDRSTSMQGQKMDVVKTTARKIVEGLRSTDFFSLVTFSDHAEVVIPAERNTDSQKMYSRIQMIQCTGGTEIFTGLEAGLHEVIRNYQFSSSGQIVLLTDGRTYGDEEKCITLARMASEKGIPIRCLGIGTEWNDGFLDELASITGGSCLYISRPQDIQQILLKQIKQLSVRFSDETRLEFSLPKNIELHYAFRISPEPCLLPLVSPIQLGPVVKGSSLQVLLELMVTSVGESNRLSLMEGKIFITSSIPKLRTITYPFNLQREVKNEPSKEPPASEIVSALSKLTLYRMQEQVALEADAGEYEKAAEHLQRLATHLLACGERGLARTALIEAEQLGQHKSLSQEGQKEIKYGTRALVNTGERNKYGHMS